MGFAFWIVDTGLPWLLVLSALGAAVCFCWNCSQVCFRKNVLYDEEDFDPCVDSRTLITRPPDKNFVTVRSGVVESVADPLDPPWALQTVGWTATHGGAKWDQGE